MTISFQANVLYPFYMDKNVAVRLSYAQKLDLFNFSHCESWNVETRTLLRPDLWLYKFENYMALRFIS